MDKAQSKRRYLKKKRVSSNIAIRTDLEAEELAKEENM